MSNAIEIGIIGGSGLYNMPQLSEVEEVVVDTPFGSPSGPITIGSIDGTRVAFISRHGPGHIYSPSTVPYRANIFALKSLGVRFVISVSACGSLQEEYAPGHIVVPDQLFDNTKDERGRSFFGDGLVAHVSVDEPFSGVLRGLIIKHVAEAGGIVHDGGAFITIEGPRFSTKAESNVFRSWGMSIIGMTTSPEAFLVREAEMCYAVMAHVTDYDVWHTSEEPVTVDMVIETMNKNIATAQAAIVGIVGEIARTKPSCGDESALAAAVLTNPSSISAEERERLKIIVGKYFD